MDETAWLIERQHGSGPLFYYCSSPWGLMWISAAEPNQTAHMAAIRFSRKQDAEFVAAEMGLQYTRIAEHVWVIA